MAGSVRTARVSALVGAAGLVAAIGIVGTGGADAATGSTVNRRPLCESVIFNMPAVGGTVDIPVLNHAADPDRTPIRIVDLFRESGGGSMVIVDNGTSDPDDDLLRFTRTDSQDGISSFYWRVSDGSLGATCSAWGEAGGPPDNG